MNGARFDFGQAIRHLKDGKLVAREGWKGYLWLLPAAAVRAEWCREPHLKALALANGGLIEAMGSIRQLTEEGRVLTGWTPSQADMLAEDWHIVTR